MSDNKANRFRFRAWDLKNNRMLYNSVFAGHDTTNKTYVKISTQCDLAPKLKEIKIVHDGILYEDLPDMGHYGGGYWSEAPGDYVILQSTGLLDRNQKEIFEGDICRFSPGVIPDTYEVFWSETKWLGRSDYGMIDLGLLKKQSDGIVEDFTCEVIGNIYEHPELLK